MGYARVALYASLSDLNASSFEHGSLPDVAYKAVA